MAKKLARVLLQGIPSLLETSERNTKNIWMVTCLKYIILDKIHIRRIEEIQGTKAGVEGRVLNEEFRRVKIVVV